jgi:hypothetical protein
MSKQMKRSAGQRNGQVKSFRNSGDQVVKRMTYPGVVYATGAGTTLAVNAVSSAAVQSYPASEWASYAARYQQYRIRRLIVTGKAINPVQSATLTHDVLYLADYLGTSIPSTAAQVFSDEAVRQVNTHQDFKHVVTWARNPNAQLWNPTSAGVPAANTFAAVFGSSTASPLLTATTYYVLSFEWEVEFRGSQ